MSLTVENGNLSRESFRDVVEEHSRDLYRLAFRLTGNQADAEEVVQETFLRAFRWRRRFDGRARVGTWLFRIASNASMDVLRRRTRQPKDNVEDVPGQLSEPASQERLLAGGEIGGRILDALGRLSRTERTAFVLRHWQGSSIHDIAEVLGSNESAAKHAVFRAVRKLRSELEPLRNSR